MTLTPGKRRGIRRLADPTGRFKMLAVDQRPPMLKALGERMAPHVPGFEELSEVKTILARHLTTKGSALLIDPDYGYPRAEPFIPADRGLLLTLEDFRFEETPGGRCTRILADWSVEKIKRSGADGVKLLLWYRPDSAPDVLRRQQDLVRAVGDDCRRFDIPFLLELLVHPFAGSASHTTDYAEDPEKRPDLVLGSLRDFAGPEFGVDIYKLESPLPAGSLPDPESGTRDTTAAQKLFDALGAMIDKPWVMLSAGAGMEEFRRVLGFAYRAGANGYLAGRAIWWKAFAAYPDVEAFARALDGEACAYMDEINALTDRLAMPWPGGAEASLPGPGLPARYAGMGRG